MKLTIVKDKNYCYSRRWIVSRRCKHATVDQHAHFRTKKDARIFIDMVDWQVCPRTEEYKIAIKRVCNRKEIKDLNTSNAKYNTFLNYIDAKYEKGKRNYKPKIFKTYCNGYY